MIAVHSVISMAVGGLLAVSVTEILGLRGIESLAASAVCGVVAAIVMPWHFRGGPQ